MRHRTSRTGALVLALWTATPELFAAAPQLRVSYAAVEPIAQGKNVVRVTVENPSAEELDFVLHIYAKSPQFGRGNGTGQEHRRTIEAGQTQQLRFLFKLMGSPTPDTYVRLRIYTLKNGEKWDFAAHDHLRELSGAQLAIRDLSAGEELDLSAPEAASAIKVLTRVQGALQREECDAALSLFSTDWKALEFESAAKFAQAMRGESRWPILNWTRDEFLALRTRRVLRRTDGFTLFCGRGDDTWTIELLLEDGELRVDRVIGVPQALAWSAWWEPLQHAMHKRTAGHCDVYYWANSTAEQNLETIAAEREQAVARIAKFLSLADVPRVELYLFEDGESKWARTGHTGTGWTDGHRLVEIFNASTKMDAYHEPTHALMHDVGTPPAALNEGLTVYVAEHLGKQRALEVLGGGSASLYARARTLRSDGNWMPLEDLLWLNEIGSDDSRPTVSYPLAGAFVKFLIEQHGMDRFMKAYRTLRATNHVPTHKKNLRDLESIYAKTLPELEKAWLADIRD